MEKKKIAVVGMGKIGLFHLSILRNLPQVEIAALADPKPSAQGTVKGMGLDLPFYDSVKKMLDEVPVDGLFACVPPAFNKKIAEGCAARGISLFLEKPMAASLADAQAILDCAAKASGKITTAVGFMVAYFPLFLKARELLIEGAIGEIKYYSSSMLLGEVFQKQEGWRQNPKISGGGAVAVLGSHLLYLLQAYFGMPKKIQAKVTKLFSGVEDIARARLDHGPFSGDFHVSWSEKGYSDMALDIKIEGTKGNIDVTETSLELHGAHNQAWYPWDFPKDNSSFIQIQQQGFTAQDEDFVSALGTGRQVRAPWSEGLKVQRLIEGIYRAAEKPGESISLP